MTFLFDRYPTLTLYISNRCTQHCRFCFNVSVFAATYNLNFEDITKLILKGVQEKQIKAVWFSGGEPLLSKHLVPSIQFAQQNQIKTIITTNGTILCRDIFRRIINKIVLC